MRQRLFTSIFALLTLVALPLGAAELPVDTPAPTVEAEQPAQAMTDEVPAPTEFDLDTVMDDDRIEPACNPTACNARYEAQLGPFAASYCENRVCEFAV